MNVNRSDHIAVILNTNQLGGAERSLVEQLTINKDKKFVFFIPSLDLSDEKLVNFLNRKGFFNIEAYRFPSFLYKISQKDMSKVFIGVFLSPLLFWSVLLWHDKFCKFSTFYVNGNKATFPVLAWSFFFRKKITLFWHFRDFPSRTFFLFIKKCFAISKIKRLVKFHLIANSFAVAKQLEPYFPDEKILCLYNLAGELADKKVPQKIRHIGIVSMFAPWKGQHSVILMLSLYGKELKSLGIEKVSFFGGSIYQTEGEHENYSQQLRGLAKKLDVDLVEWPGQVLPHEIFSNIDLLIHSSVNPEPFGRTILEAFKTHTPVITTGLGGAGELVGDNEFALKFIPYDSCGLFGCIKRLIVDQKYMTEMCHRAYERSSILEVEVIKQVSDLF